MRYLCFVCLMFLCQCCFAGAYPFPSTFFQEESCATLHLNGVGLSNHFARDAYLGAIYLPSPTNSAKQILEAHQPTRISLYFVREKPNMRDFFNNWIESVCQGQPICKVIEPELQIFKTLLYRSSPRDKMIHMDYLPVENKLTIISGDTLLGHVQNKEIFPLLLLAWFGDYPPSKKFQEKLLAGIPDATAF